MRTRMRTTISWKQSDSAKLNTAAVLRSLNLWWVQLVATWSLAAAKWSIHRLWRGATCYGAATLYAERILSAYEFTVSIFYELQIILIVVLLKCEVDPCPDKIRFDLWPSAISIFDSWLSFWLRTKIGVQDILECHPLELVVILPGTQLDYQMLAIVYCLSHACFILLENMGS